MISRKGYLPRTLFLALAGFSFLLLQQSGLSGVWQTGIFTTLRPGLQTVRWLDSQAGELNFIWRFYHDGAGQLARLEKERSQLRSQADKVIALESENQKLRSALGKKIWQDWQEFKLYGSRDTWFIDGGCADGVEAGQAVLDNDGNLIGQVQTASPHFAELQTFLDQAWRFPVKVGSASAQGLLETSKGIPRVTELAPQVPVREGDAVVTSGLEAFPPALAVGRVSKVVTQAGFGDQEVELEPYVWPSETTLVRVPVLAMKERTCR